MTTIQPAADRALVLSFEGDVLEAFRPGEGIRYHVSLLEKLEVNTDKKGKHTLDIHAANLYSYNDIPVDEGAVAKLTKLMAGGEGQGPVQVRLVPGSKPRSD